MNALKNRKIGLVLSGGGAKGAYQVGMLRAFEEAGLAGQICAISGCSIGAYAAAIYAVRGVDAYWDYLCRFPALLDEEGHAEPVPAQCREDVAAGSVDLAAFVSDGRYWAYEGLGFSRYLKSMLAGNALARVEKPLYVCAYSLEQEKPIYYNLKQLSEEEQVLALLASGSLPYLFKPVVLQGQHLLDGGVVPDICRRHPAPPDKIPVLPLLSEDVDMILINYLGVQDQVDTSVIPRNIAYAELRPSRPLEPYPSAGTLDFSMEKLESHRALGYADACAFLAHLT